jgi:1-acyl-sn-glycerol-3-phosphate acyltransferase
MNLFSSILFWLLINAWGGIIPILYFPVFFMKKSALADHGARVWSHYAFWMLKKLCKIDYKILGLERLPKGPFIVACKHQSMWETIVMNLIFHRPAYCYKKELLHIPFYGWFVAKMSGIVIDREGGASALRTLLKQAKQNLANHHNVIIFPQGTRVPVGATTEKYPYQAGIVALYLACHVPVVPAALNSGIFWPKHKALKTAGTIELEFLDPILPGLSREEFTKKLENVIEEGSAKLAAEARKI